MSFYNTTKEAGPSLFKIQELAITQDQAVETVFRTMRNPMTPSVAETRLKQLQMIDPNVPLTSIRRSIHTLTGEGVLRKTAVKETGKYGRPEYKWEYIKNLGQVG